MLSDQQHGQDKQYLAIAQLVHYHPAENIDRDMKMWWTIEFGHGGLIVSFSQHWCYFVASFLQTI